MAVFNTKIVRDANRNGSKVKLLDKKDFQYFVEFPDGVRMWVYASELDFDE